MTLKQKAVILAAFALASILVPLALGIGAGLVTAQTVTVPAASQEISRLAAVVTTLTNVEVQRRMTLGVVMNRLNELLVETTAVASMPTGTEYERSIVASRVEVLRTKFSELASLIGGLNQIRTAEYATLDLVRLQLVALSTQL